MNRPSVISGASVPPPEPAIENQPQPRHASEGHLRRVVDLDASHDTYYFRMNTSSLNGSSGSDLQSSEAAVVGGPGQIAYNAAATATIENFSTDGGRPIFLFQSLKRLRCLWRRERDTSEQCDLQCAGRRFDQRVFAAYHVRKQLELRRAVPCSVSPLEADTRIPSSFSVLYDSSNVVGGISR
jgi:hypothetical protein